VKVKVCVTVLLEELDEVKVAVIVTDVAEVTLAGAVYVTDVALAPLNVPGPDVIVQVTP
jgi:hypothetical protein